MKSIPEAVHIAGVLFTRVDAPNRLCCWTAQTSGPVVSLVIEPAASPDVDTLDLAAQVLTGFEQFVETAAAFLRVQLRSAQYSLSAEDMALLDNDPPPFAEPEAVIWGDGTWMLRFTESSLSVADDYGIAVHFSGSALLGVEILAEAEPVEDDQ